MTTGSLLRFDQRLDRTTEGFFIFRKELPCCPVGFALKSANQFYADDISPFPEHSEIREALEVLMIPTFPPSDSHHLIAIARHFDKVSIHFRFRFPWLEHPIDKDPADP